MKTAMQELIESLKKYDCIYNDEGLHYDIEKVKKASKEFGEKKAKETREYLKGATFSTIPDFEHTPPPPPKPKKKYYHNKKKKKDN
jgi:hypothetical protein